MLFGDMGDMINAMLTMLSVVLGNCDYMVSFVSFFSFVSMAGTQLMNCQKLWGYSQLITIGHDRSPKWMHNQP